MFDRPVGIAILALLAVFSGLLPICLLLNAVGFLDLGPITGIAGANVRPELSFGNLYAVVIGLVSIVLGIGLWQLYPWARVGTLLVQVLNLGVVVIDLNAGRGLNWFSVLLAIIIIIYLQQPNVKAAFRSK